MDDIEPTNDAVLAEDNTPKDLQQELSEALESAEANLAGWKRTQADLENFRKRKEAESSELMSFGKSAAFTQLLPVIDSLQQAMIHAPEVADDKYQNWKNGLMGIAKQIETTLKEMGIQKIEAVGKKFDPHLHEAIREVEGSEDGMVAEEYQTGYTINGKLIRPAQVTITKRKE
ncbi:MAG: grpE [Candidatus Doudnabacteria bacterium]|nr:grpE [Candidatus Doudnabacteria bacterium]